MSKTLTFTKTKDDSENGNRDYTKRKLTQEFAHKHGIAWVSFWLLCLVGPGAIFVCLHLKVFQKEFVFLLEVCNLEVHLVDKIGGLQTL